MTQLHNKVGTSVPRRPRKMTHGELMWDDSEAGRAYRKEVWRRHDGVSITYNYEHLFNFPYAERSRIIEAYVRFLQSGKHNKSVDNKLKKAYREMAKVEQFLERNPNRR